MDNSFVKKRTANTYYFGRPLESVQIIPAAGGPMDPHTGKQKSSGSGSNSRQSSQPQLPLTAVNKPPGRQQPQLLQQPQQPQQPQPIVLKRFPPLASAQPQQQQQSVTAAAGSGLRHSAENGAASSADPFESVVKWKVGLKNSSGRYLTAEPFGFKLNVSGSSLRQRQTWVIVPDALHDVVYLKSHLGRYLSADSDGNVACSRERPGAEERFLVEYARGSQHWALRSMEYGLYLGGADDQLRCFSKTPLWWTCHLALHPQVHVRNLNRGRYLRLDADVDPDDPEDEGRQLLCDRSNPWGPEALITLQQQPDGRVAVRASDGSLLASDGKLVSELSDRTLFCLELRAGANSGLAFRDSAGRFLTNVGATGLARTKNTSVARDELYVLEDSYPQVAVRAFNGRFASIRQGQDLNANQSEIGVSETYQLEFHSGKWRFRTKEDKFWRMSTIGAGISANGDAKDPSTLFELQPVPHGRVSLRCSNGSYLSAKKLGAVNAASAEVRVEEQFQLLLLNRPVLVFRCGFGFVGVRNDRLECNLVSYDMFHLEHSPNGYYIRSAEGYWSILGDGSISFKSSRPEEFVFEFRSRSCVAILGQNGCYMRGEQNGIVRADATEITETCLWEY